MTKIARIHVPDFYADLKVEKQNRWVVLRIGDIKVPLSPDNAYRLADEIIDHLERKNR